MLRTESSKAPGKKPRFVLLTSRALIRVSSLLPTSPLADHNSSKLVSIQAVDLPRMSPSVLTIRVQPAGLTMFPSM